MKIINSSIVNYRPQQFQKEGPSNGMCIGLSNEPENIDHIFFRWPIARFAWCSFTEAFGWDSHPISRSDFMGS